MTWQDWIILGVGTVVLGPLALFAFATILGGVIGVGSHMHDGLFVGFSQQRRLNRELKRLAAQDD